MLEILLFRGCEFEYNYQEESSAFYAYPSEPRRPPEEHESGSNRPSGMFEVHFFSWKFYPKKEMLKMDHSLGVILRVKHLVVEWSFQLTTTAKQFSLSEFQ